MKFVSISDKGVTVEAVFEPEEILLIELISDRVASSPAIK